ncbi:Alpha/Beta hydrolase protein [Aspergillus fruticulosus]
MAGVEDVALFQPLLSSLLTKADTENFPRMWLRRGVATDECVAYSLLDNLTLSVECDQPLRALCTDTAKYQLGVELPSPSRLVFVDAPQGWAKGFRDRLTARFQGSPYAKPPVGKRRLRNPERLNGLPSGKGTSVFDGTAFGPICPQVMPRTLRQTSSTPDYSTYEDCLYFNVYTPRVPSKNAPSLLPVLFWIHGGANHYGGSSLPFISG